MIEITNRNKFSVSVMVRSKVSPKSFTTLNIPAVGAGRNVVLIEDEMHTDELERAEKVMKLISTRTVNKPSKGE